MGRAALRTTAMVHGPQGQWATLVGEAKAECAIEIEVNAETRKTYQDAEKQLSAGEWDFWSAAKGTRYTMKAAGQNMMRRQLRKLMRESRAVLKDGENLLPVRMARYGEVMGRVELLMQRLRDFQALPWSTRPAADAPQRIQKNHKQRPATDDELVTFYEAAERSDYLVHFMVAEFSGCRGAEFGKRIRMETAKKGGVATISFFVEGAKADGKKKGLDLRCVEVPFPADAAEPVQRRWLKLAKMAAKPNGHVVFIKPTNKSTAGKLFTGACQDVSKASGVHVAAYGLRNRFSAQTKQANPGDAEAVALALGHQTTETQRHYARASRGGGGVSPVASKGVNIAGHKIRGAHKRTGPPSHVKQGVALRKSTLKAPPSGRPRGPRL